MLYAVSEANFAETQFLLPLPASLIFGDSPLNTEPHRDCKTCIFWCKYSNFSVCWLVSFLHIAQQLNFFYLRQKLRQLRLSRCTRKIRKIPLYSRCSCCLLRLGRNPFEHCLNCSSEMKKITKKICRVNDSIGKNHIVTVWKGKRKCKKTCSTPYRCQLHFMTCER